MMVLTLWNLRVFQFAHILLLAPVMVLTHPLQLAPNMFSYIATSAFANVYVNRYTFKLALCGPA